MWGGEGEGINTYKGMSVGFIYLLAFQRGKGKEGRNKGGGFSCVLFLALYFGQITSSITNIL